MIDDSCNPTKPLGILAGWVSVLGHKWIDSVGLLILRERNALIFAARAEEN